MGWTLGVDLGTTYTAAAVLRDGQGRMVNLGQRAAAVPSVVFLREDDTILIGEAAVRRGVAEPDRVAREFKRRVGDPAPILLGGVPMSADALLARLLAWTVDVASAREGGPPDRIVVCHPANWGPYKLELLEQTCRRAGLDRTEFLSEPEAAVTHYAAQERVEAGAVVAVYDLGGGTFDAALLRKAATGFEILGRPEGIERLGGIDFDEAVLAHTLHHLGDSVAGLEDDPASRAAFARLRRECVEAKEALSADSETSIPVTLPGLDTEVRLTRGEFESAIRVPLLETIGVLRQALVSAGVEAEELDAVLLVGGSSRIPMVAEMVGAELRRPVAVDADPKHAVALGAALTAVGDRFDEATVAQTTAAPAAATTTAASPTTAFDAPPPTELMPVITGEKSPTRIADHPSTDRHSRPSGRGGGRPSPPTPAATIGRRWRRPLLVGMSVLAVALAAAAGAVTLQSSGPAVVSDPSTVGDVAGRADGPTGSAITSAPAATNPAPPSTIAASPSKTPRDAPRRAGTTVARSPVGGTEPSGASSSSTRTSVTTPRTGWISPCPGGPAVCITSLRTGPAGVTAGFAIHDVDLTGRAGTIAVFFLTDVGEADASGVDDRTGTWAPWRSEPPFTGFMGRWTAGQTLCVLVGDDAGGVTPDTGNCAQLPPN